MGWQVHGTDIKEWDAPPSGDLEKVDAHVTARDDLALLVLVADCLPVALAGGDRIAMVHCGWRGLAGGILAKAVEHFAVPPAAAVGPGIEKCCYEVGDEVRCAIRRDASPTGGCSTCARRPTRCCARRASNRSSTSTCARVAARTSSSHTAATAA